jgi:mannose-1-phosphate guanylyltransferase
LRRRDTVLYIVIIAGGKGERFWPKSVQAMPKQFHRIVTERSMIQETFNRVYPEIEKERIFVAAGAHLKKVILEQLPEVGEENLIIEPMGKNTAPAIGLASVVIGRRDPEAQVAVLSADHVVDPREEFLEALQDAARAAKKGYIVTFGIAPSRPATEFGYIEVDQQLEEAYGHEIYTVRRFREKPSYEQAEEYLHAGNFLWNSGMFIFNVQSLLEDMSIYMPDLHEGLMRIGKALGTDTEERVKEEEFNRFASISIDYGVMEKSSRIACLKPRFSWDDVGSWSSLERHRTPDANGNILEGNVVTIDSADNIVIGDAGSIVTIIGMRDTICVKDGERILICHKRADQKIKEALKQMGADAQNLEHL